MENTPDKQAAEDQVKPDEPTVFKKPILIGKIGKLPKKLLQAKTPPKLDETLKTPTVEQKAITTKPEANINVSPKSGSTLKKRNIRYYVQPSWSKEPPTSHGYTLEVLKNGSIVQTVKLAMKAFWIFGKLPTSDVCLSHPTISKGHAILQYGSKSDESDGDGFYIYDLGSSNGTFVNKKRIRPNVFVRIKVGHMFSLAGSTRRFILNGPESDAEAESELSATELVQKMAEEKRRREEEIREAALKAELERKERERLEEERGIDWGLDDADPEMDLAENPYAETSNEELYIDDPKKALRGFFERWGEELKYDCTEQGIGQFFCKVQLPIMDNEIGSTVEVLHKGKKKEAVIQCALEACRILDKNGLLRQAKHESRKRPEKNWEENDFYDSDEDTFLDRTGTIEKKRQKRMNAKRTRSCETYESLMEKEKSIREELEEIEKTLTEADDKLNEEKKSDAEEDPLDSYMKALKQPKVDKQTVTKLKIQRTQLMKEHANTVELINIAKPADMPPILVQNTPSVSKPKSNSVIYGKRLKLKLPAKQTNETPSAMDMDEVEEENEEKTEAKQNELEQRLQTKNEVLVKGDLNTSQEQSSKSVPSTSSDKLEDAESLEKKKKKNLRRIQQRQEKAEIEKQKGYEEDAAREDYNMWVPPTNQSGDGRTTLNDKLGY